MNKSTHLKSGTQPARGLNKARACNASAAAAEPVSPELLSQAQTYLNYCKNRDPGANAFKDAYDEFQIQCTPIICNFACRCGTMAADVAECCQNVWVALCKHLPGFQHGTGFPRFETWLYQIVKSKAADVRRSRKHNPAQASEGALLALPDERASLDHRSNLEEMARFAWSVVVARFSKLNSQILRLRLIERISSDEVAKRLGLTDAQVRQRYCRTLNRLRALGAAVTLGSLSI
jgi:RNA polymerase sigma factor (sigma-70 family)